MHRSQDARRGVPIHLIRKLLGHASLATTERYLDHLEPLEAVRAMQALSWDEPKHQPPPLADVA